MMRICAPRLPAPGLPGLALVASILGVVQLSAGYIPHWVRWNYEGIERKLQCIGADIERVK